MTSLEIILFVYTWLFIVIGIAMILRTKLMAKWVNELMEETEDLFGMGFWTLIMGLVVMGIAGYQITWESTLWLLPLLGWLTVLKGALLVLFPDVFKPLVKPFYKSSGMMMFAGVVALAIGIWMFTLM